MVLFINIIKFYELFRYLSEKIIREEAELSVEKMAIAGCSVGNGSKR